MAYRIAAFCAGEPSQVKAMSEMIEMLYRSARLHDPAVEMTILTDSKSSFDGLEVPAVISRHNVDAGDVMLARTRAQADFVSRYDFEKPLAFLDLDILVTSPLAPVFERSFGVALTSRHARHMPINGGVILASNRTPQQVRAFFDRFLDIYVTNYSHQAGWWGDQNALGDLLRLKPEVLGKEIQFSADGIDYLILPSSTFNFSPRKLWRTLACGVQGKYLLHFKGKRRKRFMKPYFDLHIASAERSRVTRVVQAYWLALAR